MGEVFKAEDVSLGRRRRAEVPSALRWWATATRSNVCGAEARAASVLNHPGICTIHAIEEAERSAVHRDGVPGRSTAVEPDHSGPLPMSTLVPIAIQIADGSSKPRTATASSIATSSQANIFVTKRQQAKILDFGLVKVSQGDASSDSSHGVTMHSEALTTTPGMTVGTIAYMSPEQARGEALDTRTDLFSFGLVLYEMATGRRAFGGTTTALVFDAILNRMPTAASEVNPNIPVDLDRIIGKAVEKERQLRYQSALRSGHRSAAPQARCGVLCPDSGGLAVDGDCCRRSPPRSNGFRYLFISGRTGGRPLRRCRPDTVLRRPCLRRFRSRPPPPLVQCRRPADRRGC
jgi:serine/threonine protein kinase